MTTPVIYKVYNTTNNNNFYIGSTKNPLNDRLIGHKANARSGKNNKLYKAMREAGLNDWQIELVEQLVSDDRTSMRQAEQEKINELNPPLNQLRAFTTEAERISDQQAWVAANVDKVKANKQAWKAANSNKYKCNCGYHTAMKAHFTRHLRRRPTHEEKIEEDDEVETETESTETD